MNFIVTTVVMFVFWLLLSGEFMIILILSAIIASLFVSYSSHDLLIPGKLGPFKALKSFVGVLKYLPWLAWEIIISSIALAYRTLHPDLMIAPRVIKFKTDLKTDLGLTMLANSITLTPGTVTMSVNKKGEFVVHTLSGKHAKDLLTGEMQARVKKVEGE